MPKHPEASAPRHTKKPSTLFQFFAHPAIYLVSFFLMAWWFYWLYVFLPFTLPLSPTIIAFFVPLAFGQIGMVRKRHYVQALLAFLLVLGLIYPTLSIPGSTSDAQWRREEPAMVLLADTIMHDPKHANTKGTVEIPLPENLSTLTKGRPLRVEFSKLYKGSCSIYFYSGTRDNGTNYIVYENSRGNVTLYGSSYFGDIRENFHKDYIKD